jgi:CRP-like cAMP-binding protein
MNTAVMTIEDDIVFLERVPILRRLGTGGLRSLAIGAESQAVEAGQTLFELGEAADAAFVVQRGSFSLTPNRSDESEVVVGPGTLLGELALLAATKRPVTATAREDSSVLRISRAMFLKVLESYPEATLRLRELIATRTDRWTSEIGNIRTALMRGPDAQ